MDRKTMLLRYFVRYGEEGARHPSLRGCYELAVPDTLAKAITEKRKSENGKAKHK